MSDITIGAAVFDDYEGAYFTFQSMRLNNQSILSDIDFFIVDNMPSPDGRLKSLCDKANIRYHHNPRRSTAVRNDVFTHSQSPWTMCVDSHVLLEASTIERFIDWTKHNEDCRDLIHGPMLYDWLDKPATHMDPVWRSNMWGVWRHSNEGADPEGDAFEIPMHGMGLFACKTDAWLGFSPLFKGFGGEEGYIHEKFRQAGQTVLCLPFLRWLHRFKDREEVPYPLATEERVMNYFLGHLELGLDLTDLKEHFKKEQPSLDMEGLEVLAGVWIARHAEAEELTLEDRFTEDSNLVPMPQSQKGETKIKDWEKCRVDWHEDKAYRFIRFDMMESKGNSVGVLQGMEVFGKDGNRLIPESISATSEHDRHQAKCLADGGLSFWATHKEDQLPQQAMFEFKEPTILSRLELTARNSGIDAERVSKFQVCVSEDGVNWEIVSQYQ